MAQKIKVIQIGGNIRINGISSFIMTEYRQMSEKFEFIFINTASTDGYYKDEIESLGGKVYRVFTKKKGLFRALYQAKMIRRIIKEEQPNVVHSHYFSNNGLYLKQAYLENVPVRISHCHQANENGLSFLKRIARNLSQKMIQKYATKSLACSDSARRFLYKNSGEVLLNPIDYAQFKTLQDKNEIYSIFNLSKEYKYCLFVGRLVYQKNVEFLIETFKKIKNIDTSIKLIIVGYGEKEDDIRKLISESNLNDTITLLPSNSNANELLNISKCFVLPSRYEGLPITLIEAQATGIRCLVSDIVTQEVQLGLITYLPLDTNLWTQEILRNLQENYEQKSKYNYKFDSKYVAHYLSNCYMNIDSEEWLQQGKEYSLGSKRFLRNKFYSFDCFYQAHKLGNLKASFYYALGYFEGNGVGKDRQKAQEIVKPIVSQIEKLADAGNLDYEVIIADMYSFGLGKLQSYGDAFRHYLVAAKGGNLDAQCNLGYMYLVGQGISLDKAESAFWWKTSADSGYLHSMRDIGQSYLNGYGVPQDYKEACKYFQMASERNYSHGTCDLAYCYLHGLGMPRDINKAAALYLLGIKQDEERATRDLIENNIDVLKLKNIGELKFLQTSEITEINENNTYNGTLVINRFITKVSAACFYNAIIVHKIFVVNDNEYFSMQNGVLYNKNKTVLVHYPIGNKEESFEVLPSVVEIGEYAFQNARNLKKIILTDRITQLGISAFDDCKALEKIVLPSKLLKIGNWCFHGCDMIQSFVIPIAVEVIGKYAFGSCESLANIEVEGGNQYFVSIDGNLYDKEVEIILQYAIGKKEDEFHLPDSVLKIAFRAFSDAYNIVKIDCNNVMNVSEKAFYYAKRLKKILFNEHPNFNGKKIFGNTFEGLEVVIRSEK